MVKRFFKKLKTALACDPETSLLGIYPKYLKSVCCRDTCVHMLLAALFTIVRYGINVNVH
jgi:hypothetical protein